MFSRCKHFAICWQRISRKFRFSDESVIEGEGEEGGGGGGGGGENTATLWQRLAITARSTWTIHVASARANNHRHGRA